MEKKESPKDAKGKNVPADLNIKAKVSGLSTWLFGATKFLFGVLLLPFVYSSSQAFLNEFALIEKQHQLYFWAGAITLVMLYLFVWEPAIIYAKGQKLLEAFFQFFTPLVKVAPFVIPIYTIVLFGLYWFTLAVTGDKNIVDFFLFLFGFTMSLHLVFGAKALRQKQGDFLKSNYIFGFSFVYIINLALLAFCLNLIFGVFSFVNFSNNTFSGGKNIIEAVFKQLFLR
jgi:hypothetical protein